LEQAKLTSLRERYGTGEHLTFQPFQRQVPKSVAGICPQRDVPFTTCFRQAKISFKWCLCLPKSQWRGPTGPNFLRVGHIWWANSVWDLRLGWPSPFTLASFWIAASEGVSHSKGSIFWHGNPVISKDLFPNKISLKCPKTKSQHGADIVQADNAIIKEGLFLEQAKLTSPREHYGTGEHLSFQPF
jgi:hypothetical protein